MEVTVNATGEVDDSEIHNGAGFQMSTFYERRSLAFQSSAAVVCDILVVYDSIVAQRSNIIVHKA
jgi:hypothetical protein